MRRVAAAGKFTRHGCNLIEEYLMAMPMLVDPWVGDLFHEYLFLQAVILKVILQPVQGKLDLIFSNLTRGCRVLNLEVQFIDHADEPLVVFVKVLDADAQIVRPHENHEHLIGAGCGKDEGNRE
jgi:hypothetical protein